MKHPKLFTTFILVASLSIHLYADLAISSIVTAAAGIATFLGTPSSANLAAALTDKTGTGVAVFGTTPTFTTSLLAPLVIGNSATSIMRTNTSDAADNAYWEFAGGGAGGADNTRGSWMRVNGNEVGSFGGMILLEAGNVAGSKIRMRTSGGATGLDFDGATGLLTSLQTYNNTSGSAANVVIDSAGLLFRSTSSMKYKENVQDFTGGLKEILQLRAVTFADKGKPQRGRHLGFIAEQVDAILPLAVVHDAQGQPDALEYDRLIVPLVNAIRELNVRIAALEARP